MSARRSVTWIGHATVLLEVDGVRLLTDPLLVDRLVHITRRVGSVGDVGRIDGILISHTHLDHLHVPSLSSLGPDVPIVAPRGAASALSGLGPVTELLPGESCSLAGVSVRATPAVHDARKRGRRVPALGFVVDDDLYFAGDTDLWDGMADLAPLELALLPVWGYGPTLGPGHLDPERAAEAARRVRPRVAVPIHWGTLFPLPFPTGHARFREPGPEFARLAGDCAQVLTPGDSLVLRG